MPFQVLAELKKEGKLKGIGISTPEIDQNAVVDLMRQGLLDSIRVIYNIFDQEAQAEIFPTALEHNVAVIVRVAFDESAAIELIASAPKTGTRFVSLCTGTRDAHNMWQAHSDNTSHQAWADLLATLDRLMPVAERAGVTLGVEPEQANVVHSPQKDPLLLDQVT